MGAASRFNLVLNLFICAAIALFTIPTQAKLNQYGFAGVFDPTVNQDYIDEVAGSANIVSIAYRPAVPATYNRALADRLRAKKMKLSYYVDFGDADFCGTDAQAMAYRRSRLAGIKSQIQASTLLPLVSNIQASDEWWTRMWQGHFDNWGCLNVSTLPYHDKIRVFKAKIEAAIADYKYVFPGIPIIVVENSYNTSNMPVFSNIDMIGLDVYIPGTLGCDAGAKAWFDQNVANIYDANAAYGKPIYMIGHGFNSRGYPIPQACNLQWYIDLAKSRPYIQGLLWFMWGDAYDPRGTGAISGLRSNPVQRAFVLEQGRLATDVLAVIQRRVGTAYQVVAPYFDEAYYLQKNPDVANAVRLGYFTSGLQHFLIFGGKERRRPNTWFNELSYRQLNPDVHAAVGVWLTSGFEHYLRWGASEGRTVIPTYNERIYLTRYPDIYEAVRDVNWFFFSGLRHWFSSGRSEGRSAL